MVVEVSDGRYSAQTNVYIELIDMNDNIPQFTQSVYSVSDVYEEDNSISSTNRLPIVKVCISSQHKNWFSLYPWLYKLFGINQMT